MIVIAVGSDSVSGEIRAHVNKSKESEDDDLEGDYVTSPPFVKMDTSAKIIGLIGTVCAICTFAATTVTAECCGVIVIVINVLKLYFGRPRPHAYDRSRYNLITKKCEETDTRELQDALMSHPSGHATIVTATSLLLIFELNRIPPSGPFLWLICCAFVVVVVSCVSLYIAWSRVKDRWHHPSDILAGILLSICLVPILYWVELKRLSIW